MFSLSMPLPNVCVRVHMCNRKYTAFFDNVKLPHDSRCRINDMFMETIIL